MQLEHSPIPLVEYAVRIEPRGTEATGAEPLEEGDLLVRRLALDEFVDEPYEMQLALLAEVELVHVNPEALLEADVTLRITRGDYERVVHGVVARVAFSGPEDDVVRMDLTVVPAFALLDRWRRSRIFQEKSVVDIVTELVREDLAAYNRDIDTSLLTRTHEVRDYCVQHRETDLDFIRRILAEDGIFVAFDQSHDSRERIVLIDDQTSFVPVGVHLLEQDGGGHEPPGVPVITDRAELADTESILGFDGHRTVATRSVVVTGWNWKDPALEIPSASQRIETQLPGWVGERYEHSERRLVEVDRGDGAHRDESPTLAARSLANMTSGLRGAMSPSTASTNTSTQPTTQP
jgi:type VI secretion system secreted protein VgrG